MNVDHVGDVRAPAEPGLVFAERASEKRRSRLSRGRRCVGRTSCAGCGSARSVGGRGFIAKTIRRSLSNKKSPRYVQGERRADHDPAVGDGPLVIETDRDAVQSDRPVDMHHEGDIVCGP